MENDTRATMSEFYSKFSVIVKAVFIGGYNTYGYERGKEYILMIKKGQKYPIEIIDMKKLSKFNKRAAQILKDGKEQNLKEVGYCSYESIIGFLANWNNIQVQLL